MLWLHLPLLEHLGVGVCQFAQRHLLASALLDHQQEASNEDLLLEGEAVTLGAEAGCNLAPVHLVWEV